VLTGEGRDAVAGAAAMLQPEFGAAGDVGRHGIRDTTTLGWIFEPQGKLDRWRHEAMEWGRQRGRERQERAGGEREPRAAWWGAAAAREGRQDDGGHGERGRTTADRGRGTTANRGRGGVDGGGEVARRGAAAW
jgi:hypothetical protein